MSLEQHTAKLSRRVRSAAFRSPLDWPTFAVGELVLCKGMLALVTGADRGTIELTIYAGPPPTPEQQEDIIASAIGEEPLAGWRQRRVYTHLAKRYLGRALREWPQWAVGDTAILKTMPMRCVAIRRGRLLLKPHVGPLDQAEVRQMIAEMIPRR